MKLLKGCQCILKRQYKTIGIMAVVLALVLYGVYALNGKPEAGLQVSLAFLLGAFLSGFSGLVGMWISVRSNIRTASAAQTSLSKALTIALRAGAVSGITIVAMSLIGITGLYYIYGLLGYTAIQIPALLVGFDLELA